MLPIWISVWLYALAGCDLWRGRMTARTRWLWTVACLGMVVHIIAAMNWVHHWSWEHVWEATARRTEEMAGWYWGGGVIINLVTVSLWVLEVASWWTVSAERHPWPVWLRVLWQGWLLFMMLNGAIVFAVTIHRWVSTALLLGAAGVAATYRFRPRSALSSPIAETAD